MDPGWRDEYRGRQNIFMSHPQNREVGCVLSRTVEIPSDKKTTLRLVVTHDLRGDWTLVVKADGEPLLTKKIGPETVPNDWATIQVDLSPYAGRSVLIELLNQADGWEFEAAYWAEIAVESQ